MAGNIKVDGLTLEVVPSVCTALGHLDATRANIKSTKEKSKPEKKKADSAQLIWIAVHESTGRLHGDQTGQLSVLKRHKEKFYLYFLTNLLTIST